MQVARSTRVPRGLNAHLYADAQGSTSGKLPADVAGTVGEFSGTLADELRQKRLALMHEQLLQKIEDFRRECRQNVARGMHEMYCDRPAGFSTEQHGLWQKDAI
eukprot:TRINITY_DN18475_c0_g1_i1.p1 TRINITY_DN18475_c0_g1~~TRINITY_DN18475_c0_g1_i1.p1  ORF type:complete len:104 (+),score=7.60 TRINITY_DN18475_c0_g1_i1:25-336(+)